MTITKSPAAYAQQAVARFKAVGIKQGIFSRAIGNASSLPSVLRLAEPPGWVAFLFEVTPLTAIIR